MNLSGYYRVENRESHETAIYSNVTGCKRVLTEYGLYAWQLKLSDGSTATFHCQDWSTQRLGWIEL